MSIDTTQTYAPSVTNIQNWIASYIAKLLDVSPEQVDVQMSFERYGLDSSAVVSLIGDLEHWLKIDLSPALLFDYPTIEELARYLAAEVNK
jgi:acyl carrier protein